MHYKLFSPCSTLLRFLQQEFYQLNALLTAYQQTQRAKWTIMLRKSFTYILLPFSGVQYICLLILHEVPLAGWLAGWKGIQFVKICSHYTKWFSFENWQKLIQKWHIKHKLKSISNLPDYTHTHNHFTALSPGPPGWANASRELLDFMVQGKINRGRHTDHPAGRHSTGLTSANLCYPHIFTDRMPFQPPNQQRHSTEGN